MLSQNGATTIAQLLFNWLIGGKAGSNWEIYLPHCVRRLDCWKWKFYKNCKSSTSRTTTYCTCANVVLSERKRSLQSCLPEIKDFLYRLITSKCSSCCHLVNWTTSGSRWPDSGTVASLELFWPSHASDWLQQIPGTTSEICVQKRPEPGTRYSSSQASGKGGRTDHPGNASKSESLLYFHM